MKKTSTYYFYLLLFTLACHTDKIDPGSVDNIELVQVEHPYLGHYISSKKLDNKLIEYFLNDFADKKESIVKFYSCYVIKIHFKNGQLISYRTNGHALEKFIDSTQQKCLFEFNLDQNLLTKYWNIPKDKFCDTSKMKKGF